MELSAIQPDREHRPGSLETLTTGNLSDLYRAFRIPDVLKPLTSPLFRPFARRFALELLQTDRRVAGVGLQGAMAETLARFSVTLTVPAPNLYPQTAPS